MDLLSDSSLAVAGIGEMGQNSDILNLSLKVSEQVCVWSDHHVEQIAELERQGLWAIKGLSSIKRGLVKYEAEEIGLWSGFKGEQNPIPPKGSIKVNSL